MAITGSAAARSRRGDARRRARGRWGALVGALAAVLASAPALAAHAERPPIAQKRARVTLAEVASRVDPGKTSLPNPTELLRGDVEAELAAIDWSKEGVRRSYLVSASLVKLEAQTAGAGLRALCAVSATIRDAEHGTILAVVEGRARAEEGSPGTRGDAAVRAERGALSAAAHGAVAAIPEAIRRAR